MIVSRELPPELELAIAELSSFVYPESRKELVKVAHRFHVWITPSFYRTIVLDKDWNAEKARTLVDTFQRRPELALLIHHILLNVPIVSARLFSNFVHNCAHLSSLCIQLPPGGSAIFDPLPYAQLISRLRLQQLTIIEKNHWRPLTSIVHTIFFVLATTPRAPCRTTLTKVCVPNMLPLMRYTQNFQALKVVTTSVEGRPGFPWAGYFSFHLEENRRLEKVELVGAGDDASYGLLEAEMQRRIVLSRGVEDWVDYWKSGHNR